jgi:CDP-6-deoxy-D-xylo-4-hexulose-3-dehydrase
MHIPLASNGLRKQDIEAAISVLNSNHLTMGSNVRKFEEDLANYLDVKHFVMVNSGSSANLAIFEALLRPSIGKPFLKPGDEVIVPAVAWPTTIWPIVQLGLTPCFVDIDPHTLAIDLEKAQLTVNQNKKIKAMFTIFPLGLCLDNDELNKFCQKNSLIQLNDVCESLGSWNKGSHAGSFGLASTFSFYFSHHITTMEGGGIATNNSDFANDLRSIRSHGWSRDRTDNLALENQNYNNQNTNVRPINQSKFLFVTTGFNIRPTEVQAAIGIEQLKDLDLFVARRRLIAKEIKKHLENTKFSIVDAGTLEDQQAEKCHSWMLLAIKVLDDLSEEKRFQLKILLDQYSIDSRPVLTGNFLTQPAVKNLEGMPKAHNYPCAELVSKNYFMVGCHQDLSDSQVEYLGESLKSIAKII